MKPVVYDGNHGVFIYSMCVCVGVCVLHNLVFALLILPASAAYEIYFSTVGYKHKTSKI